MARHIPLHEYPHSDWNRLRIRANLSIRDLDRMTGRHLTKRDLSLIDQGRLTPTPEQSAELLAILRPDHPGAEVPGQMAVDEVLAE